jgi:hypothetical protein
MNRRGKFAKNINRRKFTNKATQGRESMAHQLELKFNGNLVKLFKFSPFLVHLVTETGHSENGDDSTAHVSTASTDATAESASTA